MIDLGTCPGKGNGLVQSFSAGELLHAADRYGLPGADDVLHVIDIINVAGA